MSVATKGGAAAIAEFVVDGSPPAAARQRAVAAFGDTAGVILAGAREPAARMAQQMVADESAGECRVLARAGTARRVTLWESRRPPGAVSRRTWAAWSSRFTPAWPPATV